MVDTSTLSQRQRFEDDRIILSFLLPLGAVAVVATIMVTIGTLFLNLEENVTVIVDLVLMCSTMIIATVLALAFPSKPTGPVIDVVAQRVENFRDILRAQVEVVDPLVERASAEALAAAEHHAPLAANFALAAAAQRVLDVTAQALEAFDQTAARELRTAGSTTAQAQALQRVLLNDQFIIRASSAAERRGYAANTARPELADHCGALLRNYRAVYSEGGHPVEPSEAALQDVRQRIADFPQAAAPLLRLVSALKGGRPEVVA